MRVSKTPGRTQLINFLRLNRVANLPEGRLVDLPGYGYAKASKEKRKTWGHFVDEYLTNRENLYAVVLLIDVRHSPFESDLQMIHWCGENSIRLLILLNKADKLKRNRQLLAQRAVDEIVSAYPNVETVLFSATNGIGVDTVRATLRTYFDE